MFDQYRYPDLLDQYHGVIVHVLNRLNVYPSKPYFDDLYQIAQIGLYQAAEDFEGDPLTEADRFRFIAYAKRIINWRILDELRQVYRQGNREQATTEEWVFESALPADWPLDLTLNAQIFLEEATKVLTTSDLLFLHHVIQSQGKMKFLLNLYPISRQAIYAKKIKLANKLYGLRHLLTD